PAEGNHRVRLPDPGAAVALAHLAAPCGGGRGRMSATHEDGLPRERTWIAGSARWWLGALAVLVLPPWLLPEFPVTLLNYIGLATLVALGLVVMTGVAGIVSFGQQAFVGIAAYATAALTVLAGGSPWLGLIASLLLVAACAALIGWVTLRLSGHYLSLATIAWGIAIYYLFGNLPMLGQYSGVDNVPAVSIAGWVFDTGRKSYVLIWITALAALVAAQNLLDSRSGRAIRALRFRASMAESCGVDTAALKQVVFIQAALLAGLAGWLHAHFLRFVSPHAFNVNAGIDYLFMAVIGGASSVWGALVGASIMTVAKEWLKDLLPQLFHASGNYETIVFGVLMILLLRRTREGLVPALARWWPQSWRLARAPRGAAARAACARHAAAASERPAQAVWRSGGGQGHVVFDARRRDPGADRPQRRRQDHDVQPDQRRAGSQRRRGPPAGRAHRRETLARHRAARPGTQLPACAPGLAHVGPGQRGAWRAPARRQGHGRRDAAHQSGRGGPAAGRGRAPDRAHGAGRVHARKRRQPAAGSPARGGDRPCAGRRPDAIAAR